MAQMRKRTPRQSGSFLQIPVPDTRMAPAEAVRWLLKFADEDLGAASEAKIALLAEEALAFIGQSSNASLGRWARRMLTEWQAAAKERLESYFTKWGWKFMVNFSGSVHGLAGGKQQFVSTEMPGGTSPEEFCWRGLQAILGVGGRFRRCQNPKCRRAFVGKGHQIYCSIACGNTLRVAKFRKEQNEDPARRESYLLRRKAAYAARVRKRQGFKAAVRIGRGSRETRR